MAMVSVRREEVVVGWLVDVVGRLCGQSLWNAWTAVSTVWDAAYRTAD